MTGIGGSDETGGAIVISNLNRQANYDGIDTAEIVREGLIELRNEKLKAAEFGETVLLTHAIWWMSTIQRVMDGANTP